MEEKDMEIADNSEVKEKTLSFMHETIKEKPMNRKKLFRRTLITAFSALVFGVVACFTFLILEPVISNRLYPEEITKVKFPEDEEEKLPEEMLTEDILQEELQADILQQVEELTAQETDSMLTIDAYEQIYKSMYNVSKEASRFMVTVKGMVSEVDWLQDTFEKEDVVSGVIVADNGLEYLVLADITGLQNSETYSVSFVNGKTAEAVLKDKHNPTGIGIFAVKHTTFNEKDSENIEIAVLGNSNGGTFVGKPVMAIGRPTGQKDSLLYGMVSAKSDTLNLTDSVYQLVDTDMRAQRNASGVLINFQKEVIGIIANDVNEKNDNSCLSAIGISDLKMVIEKLSNGEKIPYSGIRGKDVTKEAHDEMGVPFGAYVMEAEMGSPAMEAGILNGDIISQIDTTPISSFKDYKLTILTREPGDSVTLYVKRFAGNEYTDMHVKITLGESN